MSTFPRPDRIEERRGSLSQKAHECHPEGHEAKGDAGGAPYRLPGQDPRQDRGEPMRERGRDVRKSEILMSVHDCPAQHELPDKILAGNFATTGDRGGEIDLA